MLRASVWFVFFSSYQNLPSIVAVEWGSLIMGKPSICTVICSSYGGVASGRTFDDPRYLFARSCRSGGWRVLLLLVLVPSIVDGLFSSYSPFA